MVERYIYLEGNMNFPAAKNSNIWRGSCRAAGSVARREGASLSGAAGTQHRRQRSRRLG